MSIPQGVPEGRPASADGGQRTVAGRLRAQELRLLDPEQFEAAGLFESDEEVDEFIAAVRRWRAADV